jgi:ribosomal protein S27AE
MVQFADSAVTTTVRPFCPKCGAPMWLIRIEPHKRGFARRTLECPRCQNRTSEVIALEKVAS